MSRLKNIVMICEFAQFSGGSQNIAIGSALELSKRGYRVFFFTAIGEECRELKESNICVKHLNITNITVDSNRAAAAKRGLYNSYAANELELLLNGLDRDETIIHIHSWSNAFSSSVVKRASDLGFKTVITLHDYLIVCPNGGFYDYRHHHICAYEPMSLRCVLCNCDRRSYPQKLYRVARQLIQNNNIRNNSKLNFITISDLSDKLIRPRIKSKNIYRVNNFVHGNPDMNNDRTRSDVFIFVGRLVQEKGVDIFCRAFSKLKLRYPSVKAMVLGSGPLQNILESTYPDIEFMGWVNRDVVDRMMIEARCLVFPSVIYECSPLTVIEALTNALPCIASDCTAATELIEDGFNGFLFKAGDAGSLEHKMEASLANDKYEKVVENIRKTFDASAYTCSAYTDRVIHVYRQIEKAKE